MTIQLNGKPHELDPESNILNLLESINLANKPVVVEVNKVAIFPRDYPSTLLKENDMVEIVTIAAGG